MGKVPESSKWNKWTIFSDDALDSKKNLLSMMKPIIMCIRGSWSIKHEQEKHNVEELPTYSEAQYSIKWLIKEKL